MLDGDTEILDLNLYFSNNQNQNEIKGLQLFMQELELLVKLKEKVWGNTFYIDLDKLVFNRFLSTEHIRQEIVSAVGKHCTQSSIYSYKVIIEMLKLDETRDMLYVGFEIFDTESDRSFLQKFAISP